jgi:iron complex transport system permease protein
VKTAAVYSLLLLGLFLLAVISLLTGPAGLGLAEILDGLTATESSILLKLRLPRLLMALLAGGALSVSGALMQTLFRNPLAEPYITGVSAGGALGAVAAAALGFSGVLLTGLAAIAGAFLITLALYIFTMRSYHHSTMAILLLGLALGTFCGALVWILLLRLGPGGTDQAIAWLLGRVSTVGYLEILVLIPAVLIGLVAAFYYIPDLDCLLLGEEKAASLGVNTPAARQGILGAAALLAAACVAFCGIIAFVGLMVPHVGRWLVGATHARLLPLCAVGGGVLLVAIDLVSRTIDPPREIPLTIITSLLGAPFFIAVLLRAREVTV